MGIINITKEERGYKMRDVKEILKERNDVCDLRYNNIKIEPSILPTPFSEKDYNENDSRAREKAKEIFTKDGFIIKDNPNKYGVDLFVYDKDGNYLCNVETEVKLGWEGSFKFPDIQFPKRKSKYAKLEKKTLFLMFNSDLSQYLIVKGKDLLECSIQKIPNRRNQSGEEFYKVPLDKAVFKIIKGEIT